MMNREDFEERGLWGWLAQALAEVDFSLPIEGQLRRIGCHFKVRKTPFGDLILFDKPNIGGDHEDIAEEDGWEDSQSKLGYES